MSTILDFNDFKSQCVNTTYNTDTVRSIRVPYISCDTLYVGTAATIASGVTMTNLPTSIVLTDPAQQLGFRPSNTGSTLFLSATHPATASRTVTFGDPGADVNVLYDATAQTINSIKTFTSAPVLAAVSNQISIQSGGVGNSLILTAANPATSSRVVTFPDPGAAASIIYDVSAQTLSGVKTFSAAPVLTAASNQISIQASGAGNSIILNAANPATSSRVVTFPDPGAAANIIYDVSSQTISGAKTFTALTTHTPGTNTTAIAVTQNGTADGVTITGSAGTGRALFITGGSGATACAVVAGTNATGVSVLGNGSADNVIITQGAGTGKALTVTGAAGATAVSIVGNAAQLALSVTTGSAALLGPATRTAETVATVTGTVTLTAAQFLGGIVFANSSGGAVTLSFPAVSGAGGIVQTLAAAGGPVAVGHVIKLLVSAGSTNTTSFGAASAGLTYGAGTPATMAVNTSRVFYLVITAVTTNSETATIY